MDPISKDFVAVIHRFIRDEQVDLVHFAKGQRKDDIAHTYLAGHDGSEGDLVRRSGPGEVDGVPHRESGQPGDRCGLSVDRDDRRFQLGLAAGGLSQRPVGG
jgi:hypothetical protein